jgi:glycine cleavage system H protein
VSGTISAVNEALTDEPELINTDPYGKGWLVKIKMNKPGELTDLMDAKAYDAFAAQDK